MLTELRIRDFALIDDLSVGLGAGLNVLTGETGAGKSIVVGALSLLLGERASADVVRAGADRAAVEGVFELADRPEVRGWMDGHGLDADGGIVILKREVAREGRNRAWINGSPATASILGELGAMLVSLHGQHEHQTLLKRAEQRAILDAFGGHEDLLHCVARSHERVTQLTAEIAGLEQRRREALQRADLLHFQVAEIEAAGIEPDEEATLSDDARRLGHAEELMEVARTLTEALASDEGGALGRLASARRPLERLVQIDHGQDELRELFDTAYYALEELGSRMEAYLLAIEHDPERLEAIRQRQDLLFRLRSKYGPQLPDVVETLDNARRELASLESSEWEISELRRQLEGARTALDAKGNELSRRRCAAADAFAAEVNRILPELGMEAGGFEVAALPLAAVAAIGGEEIEFRVALNRGFEPRPLAEVASGGELSRAMLALKTILARLDAVPTLIFDEVDAGIGGRIAVQVGEKMRRVARSHQVLAITHLPQIASVADRHLLVEKRDVTGRTTTVVTLLDDEARIAEVARMLGGDPESAVSLRHARELLAKGASPQRVPD